MFFGKVVSAVLAAREGFHVDDPISDHYGFHPDTTARERRAVREALARFGYSPALYERMLDRLIPPRWVHFRQPLVSISDLFGHDDLMWVFDKRAGCERKPWR